MSEIQNVHNPIHFPSLAELPNGAAFPCSEQSPEPDGRWCLLGQIRSVKPSRTSGLIVQVEDKRGKEANIAIPVRDQAGRHLSVDVWQIDWCIMILNPRRIPRNREAINIRVCDLSLVKTFSFELFFLLDFNRSLRNLTHFNEEGRICWGCRKRTEASLQCSDCHFARFCNWACQEASWSERRHWYGCRLLQDQDLRAVMLGHWGDLEHFRSPSLDIHPVPSSFYDEHRWPV